jgi:selenocysteine lyase/cysteine desulfurase
MHIKQTVGAQWIEEVELRASREIYMRLRAIPAVVVLGRGNPSIYDTSDSSAVGALVEEGGQGNHLPIFSFLIRCGDRFLHYQLVCALLNDLFGIQSRGGCMCAGPFSQSLLGILDPQLNAAMEAQLLDKHEVLRPGYTRMSFPFFVQEKEIDYVLRGIAFVAEHGWKFLPFYRYCSSCGAVKYNALLFCKINGDT